VVGRSYSRTELHDSLGGNRQKGISYPAEGYHCLLFSDPLKVSEHGYADAPVGDDGYRYFGEWSGTGDMTMTGGNQVVFNRSPELYLFTRSSRGQVFRGRFEYVDSDTEKATRDGQAHTAIVFNLRRCRHDTDGLPGVGTRVEFGLSEVSRDPGAVHPTVAHRLSQDRFTRANRGLGRIHPASSIGSRGSSRSRSVGRWLFDDS
jgi:hypothetical protein